MPQQKREKIRQLHQQARQQIESLITPQQQEALKACQQYPSPSRVNLCSSISFKGLITSSKIPWRSGTRAKWSSITLTVNPPKTVIRSFQIRL
jgi:hypothetical protein